MKRELGEYREWLVEMKTWAEGEVEKTTDLPRNFHIVQSHTWDLALQNFDAVFKDIREGE